MTNEERYAGIAAELLASTNPATPTYNADDVLALGELNAENVVITKPSMTGSEVWAATDITQLNDAAMTQEKRDAWISFCAIDDHNPVAGGVDEAFTIATFTGVAGNTVSNLASLRSLTVSLAVSKGWGALVLGDVQNARAI